MAATRRLAAIMFTDMVGFSASAQADESRALARLREQEELVRPLLAEYRGREIKSTGDGFLVEFDSALRATQCAVEIQRRLHERNSRPGAAPLELRIGIHLGDVEERGKDIFGDAVNIAARVEPLAEPGGVCVSQQVFDQVRNKITTPLEKLPPRNLKNLRFPVDVYRVSLPWFVPGPAETAAAPARLAVLPFANFSPDSHDEYFADGLTEELITVLSQLQEMRVIARTSVFQYKGSSKSIAQIGQELAVGSVVEGSVRKAGNRIRITVQLIDVGSQEHTWADTYDRELEDVFAVQSEVAKRIAKGLKIKMRRAEEARLDDRPAANPESYLAYLKGRNLIYGALDKKTLEEAKQQFELAVSLDPGNARAYTGLADTNHLLGIWYYRDEKAERDRTSRGYAERAIQLSPDLAEAHSSLGLILYDNDEWVEAEKEALRALALNPSYSQTRFWYANMLEEEGRAEEALRELRLAQQSDPQSKTTAAMLLLLLLWLRRLGEAKVEIERYRALDPQARMLHALLAYDHFLRGDLPGSLEELDRFEELPDENGYRGPSLSRAQYYAQMGEKERALALLKQLEARPETFDSIRQRAIAFAYLGDLDECFRLLERAREKYALGLQEIRLEPTLQVIRDDPRFAVLLKEVRMP